MTLHVAIIMDGNGRWATRRGLPRSAGHDAGAEAVRRVVEAAPGHGVTALTLYAFSSDNWRRPAREVGTLMALGATPGLVLRLFLGKALVLGLAGGLGGFLLGSGLALWLGPRLANVPVGPLPALGLTATVVAMTVALLASLLPAWRAARRDPCVCFREV